jgi:hypothetical protein
MRARNPEARLRAFLALCGAKRVCEHTGGPQPQYRMDGMRIMAEFPKPKDDDAAESVADVERKQEVRRARAPPHARAGRAPPAARRAPARSAAGCRVPRDRAPGEAWGSAGPERETPLLVAAPGMRNFVVEGQGASRRASTAASAGS